MGSGAWSNGDCDRLGIDKAGEEDCGEHQSHGTSEVRETLRVMFDLGTKTWRCEHKLKWTTVEPYLRLVDLRGRSFCLHGTTVKRKFDKILRGPKAPPVNSFVRGAARRRLQRSLRQ